MDETHLEKIISDLLQTKIKSLTIRRSPNNRRYAIMHVGEYAVQLIEKLNGKCLPGKSMFFFYLFDYFNFLMILGSNQILTVEYSRDQKKVPAGNEKPSAANEDDVAIKRK